MTSTFTSRLRQKRDPNLETSWAAKLRQQAFGPYPHSQPWTKRRQHAEIRNSKLCEKCSTPSATELLLELSAALLVPRVVSVRAHLNLDPAPDRSA